MQISNPPAPNLVQKSFVVWQCEMLYLDNNNNPAFCSGRPLDVGHTDDCDEDAKDSSKHEDICFNTFLIINYMTLRLMALQNKQKITLKTLFLMVRCRCRCRRNAPFFVACSSGRPGPLPTLHNISLHFQN